MSKLFLTPWASSGDTVSIPETTQMDGSFSMAQGFGADYAKASTDPNYKPVPRTGTNAIFNLITEAILELQTYGVTVWQSRTGGWPQHSRVLHNGVVYRSTANSNSATPPSGNWVVDVPLSDYLALTGGVLTGALTLHGDGTQPLHAVTKQQLDASVSGIVKPGDIKMVGYPVSANPPGWLYCNGEQVSRTTYANLFAAIGTYYGAGNGSTTFHLPDGCGVFMRGFDHGRNIDPGRVFGTQQSSQFASHNHGGATGVANADHTHWFSATTSWNGDHNHAASAWDGDNDGAAFAHSGQSGSGFTIYTAGAGGHNHTVSGTTNGMSTNHAHAITAQGGNETRPINLTVSFLIKT